MWHWRWQAGKLYLCRPISHHRNDLSPQPLSRHHLCPCAPRLSADTCTSHPAMLPSPFLFQNHRHHPSQLTSSSTRCQEGNNTTAKGRYHPGEAFHFKSISIHPSFVVLFQSRRTLRSCLIGLAAPLWRSQLKSGRILMLLCPKWTSWLLGRCLIPRCCYCFSPPLLLSVPHPLTRFAHP